MKAITRYKKQLHSFALQKDEELKRFYKDMDRALIDFAGTKCVTYEELVDHFGQPQDVMQEYYEQWEDSKYFLWTKTKMCFFELEKVIYIVILLCLLLVAMMYFVLLLKGTTIL